MISKIYLTEVHKRFIHDQPCEVWSYGRLLGPSRVVVLAADQRRLSRVAEGTGPMKPQQPGSNAQVLLPAR